MVGEFRFAIGDIVSLNSDVLNVGAKSAWDKRVPVLCQIVERITQECYGGVQRHYLLRGFRVGHSTVIQVTEHEVQAAVNSTPEQKK